MCFSATASFTAAIVLASVGLITLRKARRKPELALASIPLLFAVQQLIEGLLWLSLLQGEDGTGQTWLIRGYIAFAGIVWPLLMPSSLFLIEPERFMRRLMLPIIGVGAGVALYTLHTLFSPELGAAIANSCIRYTYPVERENLLLVAYVAATCSAFFLSSHRALNLMGLVNAAAFLLTYHAYAINLVSGWCLLAAVSSGFIWLHFSRMMPFPAMKWPLKRITVKWHGRALSK
jgi:hypothetical protein